MLRLEPHLQEAEHVIWDWNGTLLCDLHHTLGTVNKFLIARNLPALDVQKYREVFGFPIREYYQKIGFDLNQESFEQLCLDFVDEYMSKVFSCSLFPGAKDLLSNIKASGRKQSILSASDQESLNRMVSYYELESHLDHIYGIPDKMAASKVGRGLELLKAADVDPVKTILIGDTDHDLEVGTRLGVQVLLLAQGHQNQERLQKIHDKVIFLNHENLSL